MEFNFDFIIEILKQQKPDILRFIILQLMMEEKVTYQDITTVYINYLEAVKEGAIENYDELKGMVIKTWAEGKANAYDNTKATMHYLLDKKKINGTHEDIDKHK